MQVNKFNNLKFDLKIIPEEIIEGISKDSRHSYNFTYYLNFCHLNFKIFLLIIIKSYQKKDIS